MVLLIQPIKRLCKREILYGKRQMLRHLLFLMRRSVQMKYGSLLQEKMLIPFTVVQPFAQIFPYGRI